MLDVNEVCKSYGKLVANDHVSLKVRPGEIAVLLGPNGAGKSTLIKCITGLLRFGGSITIDGYPNKSLDVKRRLGYVPETPVLYDLLTVSEHLEFIGRAYRTACKKRITPENYWKDSNCGIKEIILAKAYLRACSKNYQFVVLCCLDRRSSFLTSRWSASIPMQSSN